MIFLALGIDPPIPYGKPTGYHCPGALDETANARSAGSFVIGVLLGAWLATAAAPSEPGPDAGTAPPSPAVEATGECPSAEAVSTALRSALVGTPDRAAGTPRVVDLGNRFEITVLGQSREYADPGRDCDERARVAAVYIALALSPPTFAAPPRPPPPPPPPTLQAPAPGTPPVPPERRASVGVALRADGALAAVGGGSSIAPGAEVRIALGRRIFGLTASAGILAPTESRLGSVGVREQRFPLGLSVTARRPLSSALAGGLAVGVALVPFTLRGEGLALPAPATRLDVGARAAVEVVLRRSAGGLVPFVDLHAELFPRAYDVAVSPLGELGSTAHLWLGVSLGVAFESSR